MLEILIAAGVVLVFLALALLSALAPTFGLIAAGGMISLLGMVVGVPGSIVYHVALARVLGARGALPRRWWLGPTDLHHLLTPAERRVVMPWFIAGAAGFAVIVLGAVIVFVAVLATRNQPIP